MKGTILALIVNQTEILIGQLLIPLSINKRMKLSFNKKFKSSDIFQSAWWNGHGGLDRKSNIRPFMKLFNDQHLRLFSNRALSNLLYIQY